ncbi:MAG: hypothetical protein E2O88_06450 [Bacteroidetes bacterium]|nr:MAG: hypothetical protein E2O88_06450 [Bacteroidota bacterium]
MPADAALAVVGWAREEAKFISQTLMDASLVSLAYNISALPHHPIFATISLPGEAEAGNAGERPAEE